MHRFNQWAKQYGGMYTLKFGSRTTVVLTDRRIIKQVMDKRAAITSNRPDQTVGQKLVTEGDHILMMNSSPLLRTCRKLIHTDFTESMCEREHVQIQHAETVQLVHDLLDRPEEWTSHLKRFSNSIIMSIGAFSDGRLCRSEVDSLKFMESALQILMLPI